MATRRRPEAEPPEDLKTYDPIRWAAAYVEETNANLLNHPSHHNVDMDDDRTVEMIRLFHAPHQYLNALRKALGHYEGHAWFNRVSGFGPTYNP